MAGDTPRENQIISAPWIPAVRATIAPPPTPNPADRSHSEIHVALSHPDSLYLKGLAQYQKQEYAAAETNFNAVIQLKWRFPAAHLLLGNIAAEHNNFSLAIERYTAVLEIDPYEPTAPYNIALTYADLNDLDNVRIWLEKALAVSPSYAPAYFELAKLLSSTHRTRDAIALLIKSAYKSPINADALVQAGKLFYDNTFFDDAIRCYRRALDLEPWHEDAYLQLGMAQFRDGQCGLATLSFAHCLNRNPKHKLARAFQKLSNSCLLKFSHPELQPTSSKRKKVVQTAFPFTPNAGRDLSSLNA